MRRTKNSSKASPLRLLWLVAGVLLGIFISSLLFLKKNVTIVEGENPTKENIAKAPTPSHSSTPETHTPTKTSQPVSKSAPPAKPASSGATASASDQYDFYTMLPQMQVNKDGSTPNAATASANNAATAAVKPKKTLDEAEQSMLTRKNSAMSAPPASTQPATTNAPLPTATPTTAPPPPTTKSTAISVTSVAPKPIKPKPAATTPKTRYFIILDTFNNASDADGKKAELALAGFDRAKVQSFQKNGVTWYRIVLDNFHTEDQAKATLSKLQANQFNGVVSSNARG